MFSLLFSNPLFFLIWAATLVVAISIHEFAHALAADKLGDPTPRAQGRLTLNPLAHLDPVGTLMLLFFGFGWGRPVQFDIFNLRSPRRDAGIIALAGPASNLILAGILSLVFKTLLPVSLYHLIVLLISMNIMLAVFNLVPVYPLDGEKILTALLPRGLALEYTRVMHQYGTIILILLIWPFGGSSPISFLITPAINFFLQLFL